MVAPVTVLRQPAFSPRTPGIDTRIELPPGPLDVVDRQAVKIWPIFDGITMRHIAVVHVG